MSQNMPIILAVVVILVSSLFIIRGNPGGVKLFSIPTPTPEISPTPTPMLSPTPSITR